MGLINHWLYVLSPVVRCQCVVQVHQTQCFFSPRTRVALDTVAAWHRYSVWQDEPDAFYDIVVGDNACVAGGIPCCPFGYHCVPGYDAVSGLGHPHFSKLASLVNRPFLARSQKLRHEAP